MKIAVFDENSTEINGIINIINNYLNKKTSQAAIYGFNVIEDLFNELNKGEFFDILFLNMSEKKDLEKFSTLELRTKGYCNEIIVVNSENGCYTETSNINAVKYLKRTYSAIGFMTILDGIFEGLVNESYTLKLKNEIVRIAFNDIKYIESNNSKCTLHITAGKKYVLYKTLNEIERELTDKRFLRCHRSYIVNMNCIVSIDKDIVLNDGEKILIRQRGKKAIKNAFYDYLSQK